MLIPREIARSNSLGSKKPDTRFDLQNKDHRQWFATFLATGSCRYCPVQFTVYGQAGNPFGVMQRMLLEYYAAQEFPSSPANDT